MKKYFLTVFLFVMVPLCSVNATQITYEAFNMGGGIWQYDYYVSDFDFLSNYGFSIFYEYGLYDDITPISASSDWDPIALQPVDILGLEEDGIYDALALVDHAPLLEPFVVKFAWLGAGNPEGQYFEIYDTNWEPVANGYTLPVPEPATLLLLGAGILGLGIRRGLLKI